VHSFLRYQVAIVVVGVSILASPAPVKADKIVSNGEIVGGIVGIAVAGVVIGVGTYYLLRKVSITGCATSNQNGLELRNESDRQTYMLIGDTADIKAGDRIRVKGKKKKKDSPAGAKFLVNKLDKNYGPCVSAGNTRTQ
jgi:hypothetical protein